MRVGFISLLTRTRGRTFIYMSVSFVLHHFLHTMVDLHSLEVMYCSWMICLKRTNVSCEQTERDHFLNWFIPFSVQFSLWRRRDRTVITWQRFVPERIRNELNCQPVHVHERIRSEGNQWVSEWELVDKGESPSVDSTERVTDLFTERPWLAGLIIN